MTIADRLRSMVAEAAEHRRAVRIETPFDGKYLASSTNLIHSSHKCVDQLIKVGIEVAR